MDLHDTNILVAVFATNVIMAMMTYSMMVLQVVFVPFAVEKLPVGWGPGWLYSCIYLLLMLEYSLWPMEICSYLFKPNGQQKILLQNQ